MTMTMIPERLAELDAVMAKATAGHWAHVDRTIFIENNHTVDEFVATTSYGPQSGPETAASLRAIAGSLPD